MPRISQPGTALLTLLLGTATAAAQGPTAIEFSFSNPGARSMGFGGAFIGLADDATAAFANPAGLVQLTRPEVSLEGRSWSHETPFTAGGRAFGQPTGLGIDTTPDLRFGVSSEEQSGVSFLSYVYPVGRWSLALYRHQLARFEASTATNGLFAGDSVEATDRKEDTLFSTDLDNVAYGFSTARRITDDFSVGLGISLVHSQLELAQQSYFWDDESTAGFFGASSYLPERLIGVSEILVDSTDWVMTAGFLWRASKRVSVGGVYRQGGEFLANLVATAGPAFDPGVPPGSVLLDETPIANPDVFGLGTAARFWAGALTFTFDWVRVEYSDLLDSLSPQAFTDLPVVEDGNELHAGIEYVFLRSSPLVALRAGMWLDPDHRFRAKEGETEPFDRALFRGGSDELHVAAGLGLAFPTFQLDLGVDLSDLVDTASISAIYHF